MAYTSRMTYGPMQSFNSASLTGTYQNLGVPLAHGASIVKIWNNGTTDITISIDGVTDHDFAPASSFFLYDISSDDPKSTAVFMPAGTQYLIKGTAGTGLIYLVYLYPIQS